MNELSLFTGAGGGVLGSKLLGWTTVGYVEWDDYCQRVLAQRIKDGVFDEAPIFSDIRAFNDEYAGSYRGVVDVITAGFPCQPFSVAGKQAGADDPRNMWPATIECIRMVRPRYALLENVPALRNHAYFGAILIDISEAGYSAKWATFSAEDQGAPIKRERLFIAISNCVDGEKGLGRISDWPQPIFKGQDRQCPAFWLQAAPGDSRVVNGIPNYMDRVRAIGNGQVPIVAATAWEVLND